MKLKDFPMLHRFLYHMRKRVKGITLDDGGVTKEEIALLFKYLGEKKVIMEIGVFAGDTTKKLAEKDNFVIGIEPFGEYLIDVYKEYPQDIYKRFIKNTLGKKIMLLPMTSEEAFEVWDNSVKSIMLDGIFIDGLHTKEGVEMDFKWGKYLKVGGIMAFHDTHLKEIKDFMEGLNKEEYKFLAKVGSMDLYRKLK